MSTITAKSNKTDIYAAYQAAQERIEQLERNAADDLRRIGVMMYEANVQAQRIVELEAEMATMFSKSELEELIALEATYVKPVTAPKRQVPASVVESQPTIEINDFDRAMYAKFKALPREQRLAIIEFARPSFGHVGIHNIAEVRAAWHEYQAQQSAPKTA